MQDSSEQLETTPSTWTVDDVDVEFLPLIYEIIRSLEKDPHDNAQKSRDSQDTTQKILELQRKLEKSREQIRKLPGIEYNTEEQLKQLDVLRNQLRLKRELLHKYRNMCSFEIPKA
ncbi:Mediator of RNA polymerase II transcription subunit 9 [Frankliniella fusca]|uniref:Mediator of RNA polymerase II transcription subunit 9 n=1 Tax=Frankliniella fusca TaxID=407009 RepID=A0AAE1HNB6_9NEOP|nr:Mediator of RNA polymerase II transcription subunit 9 [Frankliniella fusca]